MYLAVLLLGIAICMLGLVVTTRGRERLRAAGEKPTPAAHHGCCHCCKTGD